MVSYDRIKSPAILEIEDTRTSEKEVRVFYYELTIMQSLLGLNDNQVHSIVPFGGGTTFEINMPE